MKKKRWRRLHAGEIVIKGDQMMWFGVWQPILKEMIGLVIKTDYNQFPEKHMALMSNEGMTGAEDPVHIPYRRRGSKLTPENPLAPGKILKCSCCR